MAIDAIVGYESRFSSPFTVVAGEGLGNPDSRDLFEDYLELRIAARYVEKPEGEELATIQTSVSGWMDEQFPELKEPGTLADHTTYDVALVKRKLGGLVNFLRANHSDKIAIEELWATDAFVQSAFAMYEDKDLGAELTDRDGSFGFVVPARMSRNEPLYGGEVEPVIPALRYVPNELRAAMMRGVPPFIIDTYRPDPGAGGRRGYLIYAPVTGDMVADLLPRSADEEDPNRSKANFQRASQGAVNDAVDFAHNRLGIDVVGLGATLPAVTYYGKSVRRRFGDEVIVTTGHGGTVELICATIDNMFPEGPKRPGVLGLGAIGAAAAGIAAETYEGKINIFDLEPDKVARLMRDDPEGRRFEAAESIRDLLEKSDVVVSAVTGGIIDLDQLGVTDLDGTRIVDDSQPASFDPEQVERLGGKTVWVIGRDTTGRVTRIGYDYGTMNNPYTDLFGCEAEAATLYRYRNELTKKHNASFAHKAAARLAITSAVTKQSAGMIGLLFKRYGITAAKPQAFGRLVDLELAA
jgi:predicted amino acid dehydrogenase